jgi:hypothetical protein
MLMSTKSFLDSMWSTWSRGHILAEICLSVDLAGVHTTRTAQQLLAEFWTPAYWSPYSPDLNLLDFAIRRILQAKSQAHANLDFLQASIAAEWDRLEAEDICKDLSLISPLLARRH